MQKIRVKRASYQELSCGGNNERMTHAIVVKEKQVVIGLAVSEYMAEVFLKAWVNSFQGASCYDKFEIREIYED